MPPPLAPLVPIHKMLQVSYKEDIKQASPGALTTVVIFLIYAGITWKLEKVGPSFLPCPSLSPVATDWYPVPNCRTGHFFSWQGMSLPSYGKHDSSTSPKSSAYLLIRYGNPEMSAKISRIYPAYSTPLGNQLVSRLLLLLSFVANVSSFSLAESPPRDLQITAYK